MLARNPLIRALGANYPGIMIFTVVVTGNHYLMDVVGAIIALIIAVLLALGVEPARGALRRLRQQA